MNTSAIENQPLDRALPTIGWLVGTVDFNVASVRYRCAHPVSNLSQRGLANIVYTKLDAIERDIEQLDVLMIVKRLDLGVINVVAAAADASKQVYLDLCDDLISEDGRSVLRGAPRAALRAVAPMLTAITCPTTAMQSRIYGHLQADGLSNVVVKVLPDCIETDEVYGRCKAVWATTPGVSAPSAAVADLRGPAALDIAPAPVRLCWFGNWGGPQSDFGLMSLLPVLARLNAYEHRHELMLHLVSNHPALGQFIQHKAKFPVIYHDWSREHLSALLAQTQFTLITSGDDQFSVTKSPNRALLSLAAGVPVIVEAGAESAGVLWANAEDVPLAERICEILNEAREQGYALVRDRMLAPVKPALARFRIERIGSSYVELFSHRPKALQATAFERPTRIAHVFGADEDLDLALEIRQACTASGIEFLAITSLGELTRRKSLFPFFAEHSIKPSVVVEADAAAVDTRRLRGAQIVVQASSGERGFGAMVRQWCDQRQVPMMSQGGFLYRLRAR